MKNSSGIPCNETRHTLKAEKDRIRFRFVTDDGNTPSSCTVGIGDVDPLTGEAITEMTFMREYYRLVDHEIYTYWKDRRVSLTPTEKKQREEKKAAFLADFEKQFGYRPSAADLQWMTDDFMPERYTASVEWYRDQEGNPEIDRMTGLSIPCEDPFGEDEPDSISRLREIAASLTGLQADIYEWLLVQYAGGNVKLSMKEIAERHKVSVSLAYKEKDRIIRIIKERVKYA